MRMTMLLIAVLVPVMAVSAVAGDMADVGIRGGYQRFSEADDGSLLFGLFFRKDWHRVVWFEGAVMYHTEEIEDDVNIELIPIQLSAQLFLLRRDGTFSPYVQGGAGFYILRTTGDAVDKSTEYDFGWHLGLGMDYNISDRAFLEIDLRYIWLDVDADDRTIAESLSDFNNWMANVGFGFRL